MTPSLPLALIICGGYLLVGLSGLVTGLLGSMTWFAVIEGIYCLTGTPWYITAIVLLKQRHRAGTGKSPHIGVRM